MAFPLPDFSDYFQHDARWGVGVSGGGDSVALLRMLVEAGWGARIRVLHFNHGWGPFGDEAQAFVERLSARHGLALDTGKGKGRAATNAEAKARAARLAFFGKACYSHGLAGVMLAHTRSDDVEGFFIRLARGSGVRGLSGMAAEADVGGVRVVRPLLALGRDDLRRYLKGARQRFLEDPANADGAYLRVRVRKALPALEKAGVAEAHVAASMAALHRADAALEGMVDTWMDAHVRDGGGKGTRLDVVALRHLPAELGQRVLARVQESLCPGQMPVRAGKRLALLGNVCKKASGKATLGAVLWSWNGQTLVAAAERRKHGA